MSDKTNIRKIIVLAVFVLLMFIAGFIVLSATGEQDGTSSDPISSYSTESSRSSESSRQEDPSISSSSTASQSTRSESSKPQSTSSQSVQSEPSKPQSAASQSVQSEPSKPQSAASQSTQSVRSEQSEPQTVTLKFRNKNLLDQHYEKHGKDMGFSSAAEYEKAAAAVPANPDALHKTEKEDGDDVYYIEATNEFVVVSTDGYIRTYFLPDSGKRYFDKQ